MPKRRLDRRLLASFNHPIANSLILGLDPKYFNALLRPIDDLQTSLLMILDVSEQTMCPCTS
jgi:hypothetical protein